MDEWQELRASSSSGQLWVLPSSSPITLAWFIRGENKIDRSRKLQMNIFILPIRHSHCETGHWRFIKVYENRVKRFQKPSEMTAIFLFTPKSDKSTPWLFPSSYMFGILGPSQQTCKTFRHFADFISLFVRICSELRCL